MDSPDISGAGWSRDDRGVEGWVSEEKVDSGKGDGDSSRDMGMGGAGEGRGISNGELLGLTGVSGL